MVSNSITDASELSSPLDRDSGHIDRPKRRASSDGHGRSSPPSCLVHIRESYHSRGFSEGVIKMFSKSWRGSTVSAYASVWRQWSSWCAAVLRPISAPVSDILDFLLEQFDAGKQYRTINILRSAISLTHSEVDGVQVGQHPLVTRFLKGVFNNRPPTPRSSKYMGCKYCIVISSIFTRQTAYSTYIQAISIHFLWSVTVLCLLIPDSPSLEQAYLV